MKMEMEMERGRNGAAVKRNGRTWLCDEFPVDLPSDAASMRGIVLHAPEPRALLVQPVGQEEIVTRKGLLEEVSAIAAAVSMPVSYTHLTLPTKRIV